MFYDEHNPPHFHARYGDYVAQITIEDLLVKEGSLPARVLGLVIEWALLHKTELKKDWESARKGKSLKKIEPLI